MTGTAFSLMYIAFLLVELVGIIVVALWIWNLIQSLWCGAPYVPIRSKDLHLILQSVAPHKSSHFLELGSGDGRVVCAFVKRFGLMGRGVDVSPLWCTLARLRAWWMGVSVDIQLKNICDADFAWADTIYVFMLPAFLKSAGFHQKIEECRSGTRIISHGFEIYHQRLRQLMTIPTKSYKTWVYEVGDGAVRHEARSF